jgi:hypothetical protein
VRVPFFGYQDGYALGGVAEVQDVSGELVCTVIPTLALHWDIATSGQLPQAPPRPFYILGAVEFDVAGRLNLGAILQSQTVNDP